MNAGPKYSPQVLSNTDLEFFSEHGFLKVEQAFSRDLALAFQEELWSELSEDFGVDQHDRSTWKTLPRSPKKTKFSDLNARLDTENFPTIISDLLGRDDWERPASWGGFNVFFPDENLTEWDVPTKIWHWDGPPTGDGLLIFSFYGEVQPGGGGTLIADRSHRLIQAYYDSLTSEEREQPHKYHRQRFSKWNPWLKDLTGQGNSPSTNRSAKFMQKAADVNGVECQVIELTGEPGDAVFCNLGMLHCVAPNTNDFPRFMRVKFLFLD